MKKILLKLTLAFLGFSISAGAQTILTQNFSGAAVPAMPTGWTNTHSGTGSGWVTSNTSVSLYFTTAVAAAPDAVFAVVNDYAASTYNDPAFMISPSFSLSGMTAPYVSFDYVFNKAYESASPYTGELAWLDISTDGGSTWTTIDSIPYVPTNAWYDTAISLASYSSSSNVELRWGYNDHGVSLLGCAIGNIKVFNAQVNDIALNSVTPISGDPSADFVLTGGSANFGGVMQNMSPNTITSFSASYSVGGGAAVTSTFTGLSIPPMTTYAFTCTTPYTVPAGNQSVTMWVTEAGDPVLTNDTLGTQINGVASFPTKKVMVEECTGTWCGYCVRGIVYMDSLYKNYKDNACIVSIHDQDSMSMQSVSTEDYDAWSGTMISGYPSIILDRAYVDDPSNWFPYIPTMNSWFGFADMGLTMTISGSTLTAQATVTPAMDLNGSYQLEFVVEENNVFDPIGGDATSGDWSQHNYYATDVGAGTLAGCGYNFTDSSSGGAVAGDPPMYMHYHFVDRYTAPADVNSTPNGIAGSLPATMTAGTAYTYSTPFTIGSRWNSNNLSVIAMLIDNNPTSNTYGRVLNSQIYANPLKTATVANAGLDAFKVTPNPASDFANISFSLSENNNVQVTVYDVMGRVVIGTSKEVMTAGNHNVNLSTSTLVPGVYNVVVTTDNGNMTQQLSVVK